MDRGHYLDLARKGLRFPIGVDLILYEQPDPATVLQEGELLGEVVAETARRFHTPLAISRMDLELERTWLLELLEVAAQDINSMSTNVRMNRRACGWKMARTTP